MLTAKSLLCDSGSQSKDCWALGNSLVVQWVGPHASTSGSTDSISGRGTKMLPWHDQKKKKKKTIELLNSCVCLPLLDCRQMVIWLILCHSGLTLRSPPQRSLPWTFILNNVFSPSLSYYPIWFLFAIIWDDLIHCFLLLSFTIM